MLNTLNYHNIINTISIPYKTAGKVWICDNYSNKMISIEDANSNLVISSKRKPSKTGNLGSKLNFTDIMQMNIYDLYKIDSNKKMLFILGINWRTVFSETKVSSLFLFNT